MKRESASPLRKRQQFRLWAKRNQQFRLWAKRNRKRRNEYMRLLMRQRRKNMVAVGNFLGQSKRKIEALHKKQLRLMRKIRAKGKID